VSDKPRQAIVLAWGCEIRDSSKHQAVRDDLAELATPSGPDTYRYETTEVLYEVRFVYTKAEFQAALDEEGAIVIYDGHSRWGQGPAFADPGLTTVPDPSKGNPWQDHFRMGFDALPLPCVADIWEHAVSPVEYASESAPKGKFARKFVLDMLAGAKGKGHGCSVKGAKRELLNCNPKLTAQLKTASVAPEQRLRALEHRHYWRAGKELLDPDDPEDFAFLGDGTRYPEFWTIVECGSAHLAGVSLRCRVLFMNSCSSNLHFKFPLLRRKNEVRSGCVFYLTHATAWAATTKLFVRFVLLGGDPTSSTDGAMIVSEMNGMRGAGSIEVVR
jgi:hypothetical protein